MKRPIVGLGQDPHIKGAPGRHDQESQDRVRQLLEQTIAHATDLSALVRGKSVLLKPNLVRPSCHNPYAIVTDERVLLAMIGLVKDAGAREVWVGDNPGWGLPLKTALAQTGEVRNNIERMGAKVRFFDHEPSVTVDNPDATLFDPITLPTAVTEAECYINLPKMKTHMLALVTLGIKNQYGLILDEQRMHFHRNDISTKVVDILRVIKPHLTVIDGIMAVQGQAPLSGSVVPDMNTIIAGTDVVATDAVACDVMGIDPMEATMLRLANAEGLGCAELDHIEVRGDDPALIQRRFKRPVLSVVGAYPQIHAIEGGACHGCLSGLRHALDKLHCEGKLKGKKPVTVYLGVPMPDFENVKNVRGDHWCFGNCAVPLVYDQRHHGHSARFVPGCPPHILDFYTAYLKAYDEE